MEQTRILIAVLLSVLVFFIWDFLFVDKSDLRRAPEQQSTPAGETVSSTAPAVVPGKSDTLTPSVSQEDKTVAEPPSIADRIIVVDTDMYTARFSEQHAAIVGYELKKYRETAAKDSLPKIMIRENRKIYEGLLQLENAGVVGKPVFQAKTDASHLEITGDEKKLVFSWPSPSGLTVEKTYRFTPGEYPIRIDVMLKNNSDVYLTPTIALETQYGIPENAGYGFVGPSVMIDDAVEKIKLKKIKEAGRIEGNIMWTGLQDRYFITALIPRNTNGGNLALTMEQPSDGTDQLVTSMYSGAKLDLPPASQTSAEFDLYMGPLTIKTLQSYGVNLDQAVDFGMFGILAKPCLWLMNFIYDNIFHNYGVAIIILTILIKVLLWPLGTKSYKSMAEMKKLQPEMQKLREKYKNDKQLMNKELMQLYRTYKVNPMGGCLPMVVQIPVFFALYRMLYQAIELRHAPFFGWITDLSAPDRLFHFNFSVPFMQEPYGIPVLTLIMGATMFLQQKMSPPMGDPTQAKMMMLMPIFFTFIFINFSSGLVLYWLVNNVISIGQQQYIQKKYA